MRATETTRSPSAVENTIGMDCVAVLAACPAGVAMAMMSSTGNPAILAAAGRLAPTERPDICYAICFPSMTIVKIIAVQVLLS